MINRFITLLKRRNALTNSMAEASSEVSFFDILNPDWNERYLEQQSAANTTGGNAGSPSATKSETSLLKVPSVTISIGTPGGSCLTPLQPPTTNDQRSFEVAAGQKETSANTIQEGHGSFDQVESADAMNRRGGRKKGETVVSFAGNDDHLDDTRIHFSQSVDNMDGSLKRTDSGKGPFGEGAVRFSEKDEESNLNTPANPLYTALLSYVDHEIACVYKVLRALVIAGNINVQSIFEETEKEEEEEGEEAKPHPPSSDRALLTDPTPASVSEDLLLPQQSDSDNLTPSSSLATTPSSTKAKKTQPTLKSPKATFAVDEALKWLDDMRRRSEREGKNIHPFVHIHQPSVIPAMSSAMPSQSAPPQQATRRIHCELASVAGLPIFQVFLKVHRHSAVELNSYKGQLALKDTTVERIAYGDDQLVDWVFVRPMMAVFRNAWIQGRKLVQDTINNLESKMEPPIATTHTELQLISQLVGVSHALAEVERSSSVRRRSSVAAGALRPHSSRDFSVASPNAGGLSPGSVMEDGLEAIAESTIAGRPSQQHPSTGGGGGSRGSVLDIATKATPNIFSVLPTTMLGELDMLCKSYGLAPRPFSVPVTHFSASAQRSLSNASSDAGAPLSSSYAGGRNASILGSSATAPQKGLQHAEATQRERVLIARKRRDVGVLTQELSRVCEDAGTQTVITGEVAQYATTQTILRELNHDRAEQQALHRQLCLQVEANQKLQGELDYCCRVSRIRLINHTVGDFASGNMSSSSPYGKKYTTTNARPSTADGGGNDTTEDAGTGKVRVAKFVEDLIEQESHLSADELGRLQRRINAEVERRARLSPPGTFSPIGLKYEQSREQRKTKSPQKQKRPESSPSGSGSLKKSQAPPALPQPFGVAGSTPQLQQRSIPATQTPKRIKEAPSQMLNQLVRVETPEGRGGTKSQGESPQRVRFDDTVSAADEDASALGIMGAKPKKITEKEQQQKEEILEGFTNSGEAKLSDNDDNDNVFCPNTNSDDASCSYGEVDARDAALSLDSKLLEEERRNRTITSPEKLRRRSRRESGVRNVDNEGFAAIPQTGVAPSKKLRRQAPKPLFGPPEYPNQMIVVPRGAEVRQWMDNAQNADIEQVKKFAEERSKESQNPSGKKTQVKGRAVAKFAKTKNERKGPGTKNVETSPFHQYAGFSVPQ